MMPKLVRFVVKELVKSTGLTPEQIINELAASLKAGLSFPQALDQLKKVARNISNEHN